MFYFGLDEGGIGEFHDVTLRHELDGGANEETLRGLKGKTSALGRFGVKFITDGDVRQHFYTRTKSR